jgi:hypothetical protein
MQSSPSPIIFLSCIIVPLLCLLIHFIPEPCIRLLQRSTIIALRLIEILEIIHNVVIALTTKDILEKSSLFFRSHCSSGSWCNLARFWWHVLLESNIEESIFFVKYSRAFIVYWNHFWRIQLTWYIYNPIID